MSIAPKDDPNEASHFPSTGDERTLEMGLVHTAWAGWYYEIAPEIEGSL
ncbi:hypothetical protein ABIB14_002038 [Arthrobacter sp. UYEF3]